MLNNLSRAEVAELDKKVLFLQNNIFKVDRRPIDPPPVVVRTLSCHFIIAIEDSRQFRFPAEIVHPFQIFNYNSLSLFNPYFFVQVTLMAAHHEDELVLLRDGKTRTTSGSVVCSMQRLRDDSNQMGAFFVFGDLSVRLEGEYRLKVCFYILFISP